MNTIIFENKDHEIRYNEYNCGTVYNIFGSNYWDKYFIEALKLYCSGTITQIPPSLKINWNKSES